MDTKHSENQAAPSHSNERQLSDEDMARVNEYLSSPIHSVERKPFRPYLMILGLLGVISFLSVLSLLISWLVLG